MARQPDNPEKDEALIAEIRQLLSDGMERSEVVKKIAEDYDVSLSTARRRVREIEDFVHVSDEFAEDLKKKRESQKSRIVQDIIRLDFAIELALEKRKFSEMARLQSAKTTLYKLHSKYHPEILWNWDPPS